MSETVVKIENVSKVYKLYERPRDRLKESLSLRQKSYHTNLYALESVNLEVKKGEAVGIIGTNGSGKSTLLKIITGVLAPSGGKILVRGKVSALLELGAGFNMEYTGLENIFLNGTMMGFTDKEMEERLDDILSFAEIGEFVHQPVKTYSSGMFARLAFAVAINVDPDILIVDEALSVGDIFFQAKCYRKFSEFQEKGKTIIFVSHDMGSIIKYCDRTLLLNKGKQVFVGECAKAVDIYKKILAHQYPGDEEVFAGKEVFSDAAKENLGAGKEPQKDENRTDAGTLTESECAGENPKPKQTDFSDHGSLKENLSPRDRETATADKAHLWKEQLIVNVNRTDYGRGDAAIVDFAVTDEKGMITSSIDKGKRFQIRMKIRFNKDVANPIFAYTIKDRKGTEITGTNTALERKTLERVSAGQEVVVCFTQKMTLQGGQYLLSLGCTGYEFDELVVYHRIYDACFLEVFSMKDSVGYFDMDASVSYE